MRHLAFGAYGLALASALFALGAFCLQYRNGRSPLIRSYLLYLAIDVLVLGGTLAGLYASVLRIEALAGSGGSELASWYYFLETVSCGLYAYAAPRFFLEFADLEFTGLVRRVAIGACAVVLASSPLTFARALPPPLPFLAPLLGLLAFLGSMLYSQVRLIAAFPRIKDRLGRIGIPTLVAYDLVCTILGVVDSTISGKQLQAGIWPFGALTRPVLHLAWNLLSLVWLARWEGAGAIAKGGGMEPEPARAAAFGLTARELELARLLAAGSANKEIAAALGLSPNTVRNHVHNIFEKTGARNRVELVRSLCGGAESASG